MTLSKVAHNNGHLSFQEAFLQIDFGSQTVQVEVCVPVLPFENSVTVVCLCVTSKQGHKDVFLFGCLGTWPRSSKEA